MFGAFFLAVVLNGTLDPVAVRSVVADLNRARLRASVPVLTLDPRLSALALERAEDMLHRHYFGHVDPDGKTVIDALRASSYPYSYAGENLALAPTVVAAERGLWNSPGHRENLIDAHYRRIGVAVVRTNDDESYVVQVFSD